VNASPDYELAFGARFREMRHAAGLTQQQIADRLLSGKHQSFIAKVEGGEVGVGLNDAADLAHALGVELSDVLAADMQKAASTGQTRRLIERALRERIAAQILRGGTS
jgi:transcriptional regulator with XRE-family HTH domain